MSVKRGLGRGLGAILGEPAAKPPGSGLAAIRVDAIRPNPQQPRTHFDSAALAELEASIRQLGVLVPIIVRPARDAGTYEIVAGERRWRAAAAARLETIPALVRDVDDRTSIEFAVVENLQRRDLDPLEEAMGFSHLLEEYAFTQEALAERLGKSRPAIANALRLLGLSDGLKARVRSGELSAGHARALLGLPAERRDTFAMRVVNEGLSVRALESLMTRERPARPAKAPPAKVAGDADLGAAEARLRYRLGAPVSISPTARGGRIEIRYADRDDLVRLVDVLLSES